MNINQLPLSWESVTLGEIANITYGKGLPTKNLLPSGFPVFGANSIIGFYNKFLYEDPQLLISCRGAGSGTINFSPPKCFVTNNSLVINFPVEAKVLRKTFYYFLQTVKKDGLVTGSAQPQVTINNAIELKLNLPPLNEQKRIVAKIEELFSELDNGIAALKTAREQLKVYRQAILKHAFEGKLTAKWREENADKLETAEQLLARIQQERDTRYQQQLEKWKAAVKEWETKGKEGKRPGKPKPPTKSRIIPNDYLPTIPEGWFWIVLASIMETVQIGPFGSLLHKEDYVANGIPLLNPSHIKNRKIIPDWKLTITEEKLSELSKYVMCENDIVIGRRGEMGRCAVVTPRESGWLCGTGSLFARPLDIANPEFYSLIISSQRVRDFLSNSSIGTTMQNLNEKIINGIPIPVCARGEQDEIISQLSSQYSVIEQIEKSIDQEIERAEILRQSILKKAFFGNLVPQDPNDEPASKLLERIKAEKEQQKTPSKKSTSKPSRKKIREEV
ncbi:restriction endonuclease subunit S [Fluoribacter dumoffii]|uniref:restriction endonuclease subunit S n=1 Tax=Fluoribacter dumoffii TaxID=463 RepID=UPI002243B9E5|nr:restriction endonuclease subunit S [Fluoribacter dumoffii]MCW8386848.1 restriction endonuclease subunit S [Fluoribacter dumoffii]